MKKLFEIAARIAARTEVMNLIDRVSDRFGLYPPRITQVSPNTYEGTLDSGSKLIVKEMSDGRVEAFVDGYRCSIEEALSPQFKRAGTQCFIVQSEGWSYDDVAVVAAQCASKFSSQCWVAWHEFGWIVVDQDPTVMKQDDLVKDVAIGSSGIQMKWGDVLRLDNLQPFELYPSFRNFMNEDEFIMWGCGHDYDEVDGYADAFDGVGFHDVAQKARSMPPF